MQYRIRIRKVRGKSTDADRYVMDRRSTRPSYAYFDEASLDEPHVVAPSMSFARSVRDAYKEWCEAHAKSGLVVVPVQLILEPVRT